MTMVSPPVEVGEYRVGLARGVVHIDRAAWNAVALAGGASVFHSWEWLAAFEDAPPGSFEPMHLLAYQGEDLVGICPAYLVHQCPRLDYLASLAGLRLGGPILLAHSLAAFAGGPVVRPGHAGAMELLVDGLADQAGYADAWAWGFANVSDRRLTGRLLREGFAMSQLATTYLVDTEFDSTEAFWHSIDPKRRRKFERDRRVARTRGFTVDESTPDADTFVQLIHKLLAAHDTPTDVLPTDFLRALRSRLAPYDRTLTTLRGDYTLALFACWEFGAECSVWLAGLDTDRLSAFEPYHPMMAQAVDFAIANGTPAVNLGRANGEQKRRYGALPVPLHLALRSADDRRDALLHAACMRLQARIQDGTEGLDVVRRCC